MYRIITVEREYGSGAVKIAGQLAAKLGWKLWDQELTAEIARVAKVAPSAVSICEERVDTTFQRSSGGAATSEACPWNIQPSTPIAWCKWVSR